MRRLVKYCLIGLLVGVVPLGSYLWYSTWHGAHLAEEIVAQLDAEGPWRWDDLVAARPATAENQLAPELIEKVHGAVPAAWFRTRLLLRLESVRPEVLLTSEQADRLAKQMDEVKELVAEGRGITKFPTGRLRLRPAGETEVFLNYDRVEMCRQFAWLMDSDSWHQAHIGDLDAAIGSHQASWQAARVMEDGLTYSPHLVRHVWEGATLASLERTLAQGQPTPQALARMQETLADTDPVAAFRACVAGQRAYIERTCRALASGEITFARWSIDPLTEAYWRASLQEARAALLKALTEMLAAMDLPAPQRQARWREIAEEVRAAPGLANVYEVWIAGFGSEFARGEAKRLCALAALAAERFRRETKRWPNSLDELTPKFLAKVPLDPCTDQPLGYRSTRDGVVIFSVGPEGKCNGTYRDQAQPGANAAFEFRLWDVAKRRQVAVAGRP